MTKQAPVCPNAALFFFRKRGPKLCGLCGVAYVGTGATSLIQNNSLAKVWGAAYKWMFHTRSKHSRCLFLVSSFF